LLGEAMDPGMSTIQAGLAAVRARIARSAHSAGRDPASVRLIAVSKTFPAELVAQAVACAQSAFGENYAQEGAAKMVAVNALLQREQERAGDLRAPLPVVEWHFIGPIQSNKTKIIAQHFHWAQSVDRWSVAQRLAEQRPLELAPLQVCIQVNVSGEASKSGVAPSATAELAQRVAGLPRLCLRGLMTVPEPTADVHILRRQFGVLRRLRDELAATGFTLDTLSMGMSDDLEVAIEAGATMVRVGRAIFGDRP
jgi:pyridoxal phosphate enzyme (YggS family)